MTNYRKGDKVRGLGRYGATWADQPTGTVTDVRDGWVRVQWDDSAVEDDMRPEWLAAVR